MKKLAKFNRSLLECHISVVVNLAFGSRCFDRCVTFQRFKLQAAVNYANLFNYTLNYELLRSKVWYLEDFTLIP